MGGEEQRAYEWSHKKCKVDCALRMNIKTNDSTSRQEYILKQFYSLCINGLGEMICFAHSGLQNFAYSCWQNQHHLDIVITSVLINNIWGGSLEYEGIKGFLVNPH